MKITGAGFSFRHYKVTVAAEFAGIKLTELPYDFATTWQDKEYLKKNPNGHFPTLETDKGSLFESNAILRYIGNLGKDKGLYGANDFEASLIDGWLDFV